MANIADVAVDELVVHGLELVDQSGDSCWGKGWC